MHENLITNLTSKDDKYACAIADKIISESQDTDEWYGYWMILNISNRQVKWTLQNFATTSSVMVRR